MALDASPSASPPTTPPQEALLTDPAEQLDLVLELADIALWEWDLEKDEFHWVRRNATFPPDVAVPHDEDGFLAMVHPVDRTAVREALSACRSGRGACSCEFRIGREDQWRWVCCRGRLVRDADGTPVRIQGFHTDVHERRETELALERHQNELEAQDVQNRAILNHAPDGIITIDLRGTILSVNPAAEKLFGYGPGELQGQRVEVLMPAPYAAEHDGYIRRFLETGEAQIIGLGREVTGLRKDRSTFPMHLEVSQLLRAEGPMFIGITRDISERKAVEAELRRVAARLQRSNEDLDDFAYIASHDLKEPLRGISNYASFLLEDFGEKLGEEGGRMTRRIVHLTERLEEFIDSLLQYSRVGRVDNSVTEVDLQETLSEVLDSMHGIIEERGAEIVVPSPLPTVTCDRVRTGEVFRNLLTNGLKYNRSSAPRIEITWEHGSPMTFHVRDNGIGIAPEHRDRIFGMFQRLHGRDDFGGGTGIGLPLVQKIVQRHGGRIWLDSEPDRGTCFHFTLAPRRTGGNA